MFGPRLITQSLAKQQVVLSDGQHSVKGDHMALLLEGKERRNVTAVLGDAWHWCVSPLQEALEEAGQAWHDLVLASGAPPAALPLWNASLFEAFGQIDGILSVHRLYTGSRLVAVLPLSLSDGLHRMWRPYQHALYSSLWGFAFDGSVPGAAAEIYRHLLESADTVDLKYLWAQGGPAAKLIEAVESDRISVETDPDEADLYIDISESWDQCKKQFSRGLRRKMNQCIRRLEEQGALVLSASTELHGLDATLSECLELEKSGWKGSNGTAIACQPQTKCFYRGLARRATEAGLFVIYTLRLNGKLIAFELAVRSGDRIDSEKIGYDENFSRFSPGNVIAYMIAERECKAGRFKGYHWGRPTPAKVRWARNRNELVRVLMFSPRVHGRCSRVLHTQVRPFVRGCRRMLRHGARDS